MAFLKAFFGDLPVRFRASYFPSPSLQLRWMCSGGPLAGGDGLRHGRSGRARGSGSRSRALQRFRRRLGVERFCMVRHGIDDIRRLYTSDLRFLEQF